MIKLDVFSISPCKGGSLGNRGVERSDTPGKGSISEAHPERVPHLRQYGHFEAQLRSAAMAFAINPACRYAPYGVTGRATASAVLV